MVICIAIGFGRMFQRSRVSDLGSDNVFMGDTSPECVMLRNYSLYAVALVKWNASERNV